ncbi:uncharacterized protein METZ01_LOCUS158462, partial [marine metagenome]
VPEPLIFELSSPGRQGVALPDSDVPTKPVEDMIPAKDLRVVLAELPEVSEVDVVRHFTRLSAMNYHPDKSMYPLGSCTIKHNPRINEDMASLSGFARIHPLQLDETCQGAIQLMCELAEYLSEIAGMDGVTLQPAAGAHGELTSLMMVRASHERRGNPRS